MASELTKEVSKRKIDPFTTFVPFGCVLALCAYFVLAPENSTNALEVIRSFLGDKCGVYYLVIGLGFFLVSLWLSYSKIGKLTIDKKGEKPKYGFFAWGAMVFTCGLASDILFYSFCEWIYYYEDPHVMGFGNINEWAATFPLYHWSLIPWSFYAVLAAEVSDPVSIIPSINASLRFSQSRLHVILSGDAVELLLDESDGFRIGDIPLVDGNTDHEIVLVCILETSRVFRNLGSALGEGRDCACKQGGSQN